MEIDAFTRSYKFYEHVLAFDAVVSELVRSPFLAWPVLGLLRADHDHSSANVDTECGRHFLVSSHSRNHFVNIVKVVSARRAQARVLFRRVALGDGTVRQ